MGLCLKQQQKMNEHINKLDVVVHSCDLSGWARGQGLQGHTKLYCELHFKASQGYMEALSKTKQNKNPIACFLDFKYVHMIHEMKGEYLGKGQEPAGQREARKDQTPEPLFSLHNFAVANKWQFLVCVTMARVR